LKEQGLTIGLGKRSARCAATESARSPLKGEGGNYMWTPKKFAELIARAVKNGDSTVCKFYYYQNGLVFPGSNEQKLLPIVFVHNRTDAAPLIEALLAVAELHCFPTYNGLIIHLLRSNRDNCEECQRYHQIKERQSPKAPRKLRG